MPRKMLTCGCISGWNHVDDTTVAEYFNMYHGRHSNSPDGWSKENETMFIAGIQIF